MYKLIENYIYFYHTDEFAVLPTYPESIADSIGSTFSSTNALSRTAPVFSYSYSGPRTVQVNFLLHRDMLYDVNKDVRGLRLEDLNDDYVDTLIKKLQAIALPRYNAGQKAVSPPKIAIRFGDEIFIKGVVVGGISLNYQKPLIIVNGNETKYAQVTVGFQVSEVDPYDADSVSLLGGFRGLTRANNIYTKKE